MTRLPKSHTGKDSWREVTLPGMQIIGAQYSLSGDRQGATKLMVDTSSVNITSVILATRYF